MQSTPASPEHPRAEATGTLETALAHAERLLHSAPKLAIEQAREILQAVPGAPQARLILGRAQLAIGEIEQAISTLEPLAREQPRSAMVHFSLGNALSLAGRLPEAIAALETAARIAPEWPDTWRVLADHLDAIDDPERADRARAAFLGAAVNDPRLRAAAQALQANELAPAEALLRAHLKEHPTDVAALRMLAELASRLRRYRDAQTLLERCLELAPNFRPARHQYAIVLFRLAKAVEAREVLANLLAEEPDNLGYLSLQAAILAHLGDTEEAIQVYEKVVGRAPRQPRMWLSFGHVLKTAGRFHDSVDAYQRAISFQAGYGEAYWSLANLKTHRFGDSDLAAMNKALESSALSDDDRLQLEYSLGKALEDRGQYEASFQHYAAGAGIRRRLHEYNPKETTGHVRRCRTLFTPEFIAARAGYGYPTRDPIFIVGMPRAGSTLLEQILASHPLVEGTMELPNIPSCARELGEGAGKTSSARYPMVLADLEEQALRDLGERYLHETRVHRKTDAPHFIDKLPNNFLHVGLIHLMLPNARIIDARRHPLGCCFSNFKQHFARGQNFSYSLEDLGNFYRDYVELMAHFDAALPGRIHRVIYERMVDDPETEVRRLLEFCGLPFDERCLRFYENERAVRTASSEQVRQPIFRSGVDHWKNYEPWLDPLKAALGPVLDSYPEVPQF